MPRLFQRTIAALRPLPHSSHNRDSGIPQAKLFRGDCFSKAHSKRVATSVLGLCFDSWHGHCNSFAATRQNLNPNKMQIASHRKEKNMKPPIHFNEKSRRDASERGSRGRSAFLKTDCNYHTASISNMGGRCFGSRRPSFRSISQDYFKNEARQNYAGEAALFCVIVLTAALPLLESAQALVQLVRSVGVL